MPGLASEAVKRVDTVTGWLTIIVWMFIGGTAAGAWWQSLPWQVPTVAFVVFFGYGFLKAAYKEHVDVEKVRDELKEENEAFQERAAAFREVSWVEAENERLTAQLERLAADMDRVHDRMKRYQEASRNAHVFTDHYKQKSKALEEEIERLRAEKDAP